MKERAKTLSREDLNELARHIAFLQRVTDPAWQEQVHQDATGRLYSEDEVRVLDERLRAEER